MSTKIHTFNKALFLKKSSVNLLDVKETKQPLNDIPQGTVCMPTVPEVQQATTVECVIPKAIEVVEPEKTCPPRASLDQVDTQLFEALPVDAESNSVMSNEERSIPQESWNKEDQELVDWFNKRKDTLPTTHIKINVSRAHVFETRHPISWYKRLSEEIEGGPSGTQAKHGFLQQELRLLKTYVERFENIGKR